MKVSHRSDWAGFLFVAFAFTATCIAANAALRLSRTSYPQYFYQQARGFAQGRLDLVGASTRDHDLAPYRGRVYGVFGPLPAILMTPFVPFDPKPFPQRYFGQFMCALTAACMFALARRASGGRGPASWILPAGAAWGSSNLIFSVHANHWFVGQATAAPFFLGALWLALERRPERRRWAMAGSSALFGLAVLGRLHLIFTFPVLLYLAVSDARYGWPSGGILKSLRDRDLWRRAAVWAVAPALAGALMLAFNWARFDHPFDFGLQYHNMDRAFRGSFSEHGGWGLGYLWKNVYFTLVRLPHQMVTDGETWGMGFSFLAQSPIFLLAFLRAPEGAPRALIAAAWVSVAGGLVFLMNFMGTGFWQFGARYLYDLAPLLILIAALNKPERAPATALTLAAASILMNVWGVGVFGKTLPLSRPSAVAASVLFLSTLILLAIHRLTPAERSANTSVPSPDAAQPSK